MIKKVVFYTGKLFSPFAKIQLKIRTNIMPYFISGYYSGVLKQGEYCSFKSKFALLLGYKYIILGNKVSIGRLVRLTAWDTYNGTGGGQKFKPEIKIGDNCSIGDSCHITAIEKISLGNNVLLGPKVLITDNSHGEFISEQIRIAPSKRPLSSKGPVIIDDNVWIGEKASIMPGVHIGYGSIIAANAVVTKDIPPRSIAAGVPAKIIKTI